MIYLYSALFSFIGSLRIPTLFLWTLVCLMLGFSWMDSSQGWGMYHYYVNAKFFTELGYFELYECTITEPTPRRDLYTYNYRLDDPDCNAQMTPTRWKELRQDVIDSQYYPQAMIDKGYNGSPTFTAVFGTLANWNIVTPHNAYIVDIIALVIAMVYCAWSMGWRRAAYVALFILSFYGTLDRLWGHYAQWVWLSLVIVGCCQLEKRNTFGAYLMGIATSLAIFPVFLMLRYRQPKQLILFAVGLMTFLTIGLANGRGVDGYLEFAQNMSIHSSYVREELCCNVGLAHAITFTQNPSDEYLMCFIEWESSCPTSYDRDFNPLYWLALMPVVATSPLGAMFGLLTLSIYYYLVLAIVPLWYSEKWTRRLLLINAIMPVSVILDWSLMPYRNWLYFVFLVWLGVTESHVIQNLSSAVVHQKQRLYPQVAQGDVSGKVRGG